MQQLKSYKDGLRLTETETLVSGKRVLRAKMPIRRVGRAREAGETQGFMKVLVDGDTQRIVGAAFLGISGDEVFHSMVEMMAANEPYTVISRAVHIHPTVSELVFTLLPLLKVN